MPFGIHHFDAKLTWPSDFKASVLLRLNIFKLQFGLNRNLPNLQKKSKTLKVPNLPGDSGRVISMMMGVDSQV